MTGKWITGPLLALALTSGSALGLGMVDSILDGLEAQGYGQIEVSTTLLGRTRIEATSSQFHREIVINPTTGEILRDYWEAIGDASASGPGGLADPSGSSGSGSGLDDDDEDEDDGGNSGSGGGGSGSGSGGGGSDDDVDDD